jgi:hypothetical protein
MEFSSHSERAFALCRWILCIHYFPPCFLLRSIVVSRLQLACQSLIWSLRVAHRVIARCTYAGEHYPVELHSFASTWSLRIIISTHATRSECLVPATRRFLAHLGLLVSAKLRTHSSKLLPPFRASSEVFITRKPRWRIHPPKEQSAEDWPALRAHSLSDRFARHASSLSEETGRHDLRNFDCLLQNYAFIAPDSGWGILAATKVVELESSWQL